MNRTTRCRPGDLALVTGEDPGYEENLGRLVKVSGPLAMNPDLVLTWLIVPVSETPYAVMGFDGRKRSYRVQLQHKIEHPDVWLLPIRDVTDEMTWEKFQEGIDSNPQKIGAVKTAA